jgi:LysM repeat protein
MKRISFFLLSIALCAAPTARAQDAAVEERLNKLSGQIEDLIAGQKAHQKQLSDLAREVENLREQAAKPNASYASQEDVKHLAEAVKEIDRKRLDDYEKIRTELLKIGKSVSSSLATPKKAPAAQLDAPIDKADKPAVPEKGIEYVVQPGDTLSAVVQACKEKKIKVTVDQILKANPGLDAKKMKPGQKLFIPAVGP